MSRRTSTARKRDTRPLAQRVHDERAGDVSPGTWIVLGGRVYPVTSLSGTGPGWHTGTISIHYLNVHHETCHAHARWDEPVAMLDEDAWRDALDAWTGPTSPWAVR